MFLFVPNILKFLFLIFWLMALSHPVGFLPSFLHFLLLTSIPPFLSLSFFFFLPPSFVSLSFTFYYDNFQTNTTVEGIYSRLPVLITQLYFFIFYFFLNLFIYFWLSWGSVSVRGLSLVAESRGHSSSRCAGLSLSRPLLLWSTGSRRAGSVVVAHRPSCSVACGIPPDQGSNPCPLHWQADSQPLYHQGSPARVFYRWDCVFPISLDQETYNV